MEAGEGVTLRPAELLQQAIQDLGELAGNRGRASAVDEKVAAELEFVADGLRGLAAELAKRARQLKGEAAQHLQDEELADQIGRQIEAARPDREKFARKRGPDRERLKAARAS